MRQEHLTPDGWKPCTATTKECHYKAASSAEKSALVDSAVEEMKKGKPNVVKNLLDRLAATFKPAKTSSSQLESTKEVPVEIGSTHIDELFLDDDDDDEDKVIQGKDGQYEIACSVTALGDRVVTNKFGNFIKDKTTAETLHEADPHKHYQFGWCGVLAEALLNENKQNVEGYYIFKTEEHPVTGTHSFVKLKDGTYADSLGIWTEEALFSVWKTKDPTVELSKFDPKSIDSDKKDDDITTRDIYKTVNELIDRHMNGETL